MSDEDVVRYSFPIEVVLVDREPVDSEALVSETLARLVQALDAERPATS